MCILQGEVAPGGSNPHLGPLEVRGVKAHGMEHGPGGSLLYAVDHRGGIGAFSTLSLMKALFYGDSALAEGSEDLVSTFDARSGVHCSRELPEVSHRNAIACSMNQVAVRV